MAGIFDIYELAAKKILEHFGRNHPRYSEAEVFWNRLTANIYDTRLYGNNSDRESKRAEIISEFSRLVLVVSGKTFKEWCDQSVQEQNASLGVNQAQTLDTQTLTEEISEFKQAVLTGIEDLKRGQTAIYKHITESNREPLARLIELVKMGRIEQGEMQQTLEAVRRILKLMQASNTSRETELKNELTEYQRAVNSQLGLQQKLELTLPLIPMFLDYKIELAAGSEMDLNALRVETARKWQGLISRLQEYNQNRTFVLIKSKQPLPGNFPKYILGLDGDIHQFMQAIARSLMKTNQWPTSDPNLEPFAAAELWMARCREQLESSYLAIQELETGIQTGRMTDLKFTLEKRASLVHLPQQVSNLLTVIDAMDVSGPTVPVRSHLRSDLNRLSELSLDEVSNLKSLVNQISWRKPHNDIVSQIEENLLPLKQLVGGVLDWLEAAIDKANRDR